MTSTVAGTVSLSAMIDVPQLDPSHPAFSATSTVPLRILFFRHIQTIVVVPGGKVKATLVRATENPDGERG